MGLTEMASLRGSDEEIGSGPGIEAKVHGPTSVDSDMEMVDTDLEFVKKTRYPQAEELFAQLCCRSKRQAIRQQ